MYMYMRQMSMSVGVSVTLWMIGKKKASIIFFVVIVGAAVFWLFEKIASLSLEDLNYTETNR